MSENARFGPNTPHTVGTTAAEVCQANKQRRYLLVQCNGPGDIYVSFEAAATASNGVRVKSGEAYRPDVVPTDVVSVIASEADTAVVVVEV